MESFADADEQMVDDRFECETGSLQFALVVSEVLVYFEQRCFDGLPDGLLAAERRVLCFVVSGQVTAEQPGHVANQQVLFCEVRAEQFLA